MNRILLGWVVALCAGIGLAGCPAPDPSDPSSLEMVANALLFDMALFDLSGDGFLSFLEARAANDSMTQAYMDTMDRDQDGLLSSLELQDTANTSCGSCQTETFTLPGDVPLKVIGIPSGTFMMGAEDAGSDATPVHQVTISSAFQLGETEVTKAQWETIMGTTPWKDQPGVLDDPDSPAVYVSWNDVQVFITTLNGVTGLNFHLPTEAQWEYACRAGSATAYHSGDSATNLSEYARWLDNSDRAGEPYAHVVGELLPNAFQLFDMHGNVAEWCADWYGSGYYATSPDVDPTGPTVAFDHVTRGGSWGSNAADCRSAVRDRIVPTLTSGRIGFRLAR